MVQTSHLVHWCRFTGSRTLRRHDSTSWLLSISKNPLWPTFMFHATTHDVYPGNSTWNAKKGVWKMIFLFNWVIFSFHDNFLVGCLFRCNDFVWRKCHVFSPQSISVVIPKWSQHFLVRTLASKEQNVDKPFGGFLVPWSSHRINGKIQGNTPLKSETLMSFKFQHAYHDAIQK